MKKIAELLIANQRLNNALLQNKKLLSNGRFTNTSISKEISYIKSQSSLEFLKQLEKSEKKNLRFYIKKRLYSVT